MLHNTHWTAGSEIAVIRKETYNIMKRIYNNYSVSSVETALKRNKFNF